MKITQVSFILIAKNEQFALAKSLEAIAQFDMADCDVIFVDSGSTDQTLDVALSFKDKIQGLSVVSITGEQNAATARNEGLKLATKNIVFFVDGDVELNPEFITAGIDKIQNNETDAVFGQLDDYEYDETFSVRNSILKNRTSINTEEKRYSCGGIFMVKKSIVDEIGSFDDHFVKCQDFDYTLRITKKYRLTAIPISMGVHHTVPYSDASRIKAEFKNSLFIYYGKVIRKNLNNSKGCYARLNSSGHMKGLLILAMLVLGLFFSPLGYLSMALILLDALLGVMKGQNVFYRLISHYVAPVYMVYGLIIGIEKTPALKNSIQRIL